MTRFFRRLFTVFCFLPLPLFAQTVAPFGGVGSVQTFDNNGKPLTAGVLYSFQAGTSTQQATYTDATGTTQNPNPIPFTSGARATIWTSIGKYYKFVLCLQNDGPVCAPADVLFSVDNVPGGNSGSSSSGSTFTGTFISGSGSTATSGILKLATGDTICWRNQAGSANLCFSKDSNDILTWPAALKIQCIGPPSGVVGYSVIWCDSTPNRLKMSNNGASAVQVVGSGVDINSSDQVTQLHFGSTAIPISGTAPTTGQTFTWNGTNLAPYTQESTLTWCPGNSSAGQTCLLSSAFNESGQAEFGTETLFVGAHTILRLTYNLQNSVSGCSAAATVGIKDMTSGTTLTSLTISNGLTAGFQDSGALSIATVAGDKLVVGELSAPSGCSPLIGNLTMVYQ